MAFEPLQCACLHRDLLTIETGLSARPRRGA